MVRKEGPERTVRIANRIVNSIIQTNTRQALLNAIHYEDHPSPCGCPSCRRLPQKSRTHFEQCLDMELGDTIQRGADVFPTIRNTNVPKEDE